MSCGADVTANELMATLLAGTDFSVPNVELNAANLKLPAGANADMYSAIKRVVIGDLTEGKVNGTGAFDTLMTSAGAHLLREFEKGRITGAEYTKAYAEILASTLAQATQFVLSKDQVYWTAQQAQINAITAMIQLETERVKLAAMKFEAKTAEANYAITKLKLATEDAAYCTAKFNLENILPNQKALLGAQVVGQTTSNQKAQYELTDMLPKQSQGLSLANDGKTIENNTATYNLSSLLPKQAAMLEAQRAGQLIQNDQGTYTLTYLMPVQLEKGQVDVSIARYNLNTMLPVQYQTAKYNVDYTMPSARALVDAQKAGQDIANSTATYNLANTVPQQFRLLQEQTETQRAQTLDTRTDGSTTIVGYVGKQKALYSQQIDSYKRDAEIKAAKMMADGWMTQKTIDEAALTPDAFTQNAVNAVLIKVKENNGIA